MFWAVVVLDQGENDSPLFLGEMGAAPGSLAAGCSVTVGYRGGVASCRPSISCQFTADGGFVSSDFAGNGGHGEASSQKSGYGIPFFLGEVLVVQRCIPFLGR